MDNEKYNEVKSSADSQRARPEERERLLKYYWRKGIPSLVLAFVTIVLAATSYWFVQPNIKQRYRDIVSANFQLLEATPGELASRSVDSAKSQSQLDGGDGLETPLQPMAGDLPAQEKAQPGAGRRGTAERLKLLEQTQLCLRRLTIWDKTEDAVRFQTGQVLDLLGDWYLDSARSKARDEVGGEEIGALVGRSRSERQKALEAMRAAQKLNGPFADKATLWLARRKLFDTLELPTADLKTLADQVAAIFERLPSSQLGGSEKTASDSTASNSSADAFAQQLLGEIRVLQALSCRNELSISERFAFLKDADQILTSRSASSSDSSLEQFGWAADAKRALDSAAAQELANRALQSYWSIRDTETLSVDALAMVFRCLLVIDSNKEAQIFLSEQLQQISPVDQPRFRALTAAAALRHLISVALLDSIARLGVGGGDLDSVLFMVVQLNPESSELLALLERFSKPGDEDELMVSLKRALAADGTRSVPAPLGVKSFLAAVVGLGTGTFDRAGADNLGEALKASQAFGVVASRLAMRMHGAGTVTSELAIRWMRAINTDAPDVLVAWSDRASLHLKEKQFKEAIECYEFLLVKLPGNEQITEALEGAKKLL